MATLLRSPMLKATLRPRLAQVGNAHLPATGVKLPIAAPLPGWVEEMPRRTTRPQCRMSQPKLPPQRRAQTPPSAVRNLPLSLAAPVQVARARVAARRFSSAVVVRAAYTCETKVCVSTRRRSSSALGPSPRQRDAGCTNPKGTSCPAPSTQC